MPVFIIVTQDLRFNQLQVDW